MTQCVSLNLKMQVKYQQFKINKFIHLKFKKKINLVKYNTNNLIKYNDFILYFLRCRAIIRS